MKTTNKELDDLILAVFPFQLEEANHDAAAEVEPARLDLDFRKRVLDKTRALMAAAAIEQKTFLDSISAFFGNALSDHEFATPLLAYGNQEELLRALGRTLTGVSRILYEHRPRAPVENLRLEVVWSEATGTATWCDMSGGLHSKSVDLLRAARHTAEIEGEFEPVLSEVIARHLIKAIREDRLRLSRFRCLSHEQDKMVLAWCPPPLFEAEVDTPSLLKQGSKETQEEMVQQISEEEEFCLMEHAPLLVTLYERAAIAALMTEVVQAHGTHKVPVRSSSSARDTHKLRKDTTNLVKKTAELSSVRKDSVWEYIATIALNSAAYAVKIGDKDAATRNMQIQSIASQRGS